jgi:hypothetical protein
MADETIAALIPIEDGSDAEAKPLRQNFKYLDDRITAQATNISNKESISHKGAANGYCPLDPNAKIPDTYLSNFSDEIYTRLDEISDEITAVADSKISATKGNNWVKLSNGLIMQWGYDGNMGHRTVKQITFPKPYSSWYIVAGASSYEQTRGDKGASWRAFDTGNKSWFSLGSDFEQWNATVFWLAIGY